jgi:hypothetical protein
MSRQTALDNIFLKPSARWGHTEYSLLEYNRAYLAARTGLPETDPDMIRRAQELFKFDFMWGTNDGLVYWEKAGRTTDMGHASYAADGSDQTAVGQSPFLAVEEVWAFDAVAEYGLPAFKDQVAAYEQQMQQARVNHPDQLVPGGVYRTLVSGALASFGWDMLLEACADPVKMEPVFDSFFRRTLFHMKAWAQTSAEVIIQHDDFVWTSGPFMHPDIYRKVIIPYYAELWKPLHAAGKKVLFCSDGNFREFAADVAAAGADGFIFEPCNDFAGMADEFGATHCLVGSSVDCRDVTLGHKDLVKTSVDQTLVALSKCRGAILAVGNHLPANIPPAMLDYYFECLLPHLAR